MGQASPRPEVFPPANLPFRVWRATTVLVPAAMNAAIHQSHPCVPPSMPARLSRAVRPAARLIHSPEPFIQPQREPHLGFHAAIIPQPDMPAVINENGLGDFCRVKGREVFDLLEDFAQGGIRRLVLAGLPDHLRRDLVNLMNHCVQPTRLVDGSTTRAPKIFFIPASYSDRRPAGHRMLWPSLPSTAVTNAVAKIS